MAKGRATHTIPFDSEVDRTELTYVKHYRRVTENNVEETFQEQVPRLSETAEPLFELLKFLAAFQHARDTLTWTTGPKLFQKFPMHLEGKHLLLFFLFLRCCDKMGTYHLQSLMTNDSYEYEYVKMLRKPVHKKNITCFLLPVGR